MPTGTPKRSTTLADLASVLPSAIFSGSPSIPVTGIQYDSRRVTPGTLFVALVGGYFDGHDFAQGAIERGAAALLVERRLDLDVPQIVVSDSRAALAPVAATFYRDPSHEIPVIGITGTDGKTTTSYLVESIFAAARRTTGVMGTVGIRIGDRLLDSDTRQTTPESLDVQRHLRTMVDEGVDTAILEATSHGLDLHRLDAVRFTTGVVTNITHEHLEHHKTIPAYRRAKAILFERIGESRGAAVVNLDDEGAREMIPYASPARLLTYSTEGQAADITARDIQLSVDGSSFELGFGGRSCSVRTPMVGRFNVANCLAAIGAAVANDISLEICISALNNTQQIPGRMESIRSGQPFSVVVDYAHTPESIEKVLTLLRRLNGNRRLIIVMGSAGERDVDKRAIQGSVAARIADYSVFTTEDPRFEDAESIIRQIADGATSVGAVEGASFRCIVDRREAIRHAFQSAQDGDCVLLAGKGHERSIIWGHEKRPWDEAGTARELLFELGFGVPS